MTNSRKTALVQQYAEPNHDRITSLTRDGHSWDDAEEIDRLERREALLCELGAAGQLTAEQKAELDALQAELHERIGCPGTQYAGVGFYSAAA